MQPWICLCYGNGLYDDRAARVFGAVGVPPIFTAEQRAAWENYVKALVTRYRGRVSYYEVWNEPDGKWTWKHGANARELGTFTASTGKAIHAADPDAKVVGFAQAMPNLQYMNDALTGTGMAENIDAISFHHYSTIEEYLPVRVSAIRAVADMHNMNVEIIDGEGGSQSRAGGNGALHKYLWTEKAQVKQMSRRLVTDLSTEVKFVSYFSALDMIEALNGTVDDKASYLDYGYFGVLGADFDDNGYSVGTYFEKPSYYCLQTIASVFADDIKVVKDPPVLLSPSYYDGYRENDLARRKLSMHMFKRDNGSQCLCYWINDTNILTTDKCGTVTMQMITKHKKVHLVDLTNGNVYALPDSMLERSENDYLKFIHIPVLDTPLALVFGDFCKF